MSAAVKYRHLPLGGSLAAHFEKHADGTTRVTSAEPLAEYPRRLTDRLLHWAAVSPEHTLAAKRHHGGDWRRISYAQALASARSIAQALLDLGLSPQRPLVILSDNDLEHLRSGSAPCWRACRMRRCRRPTPPSRRTTASCATSSTC
jgi:feruloyl-CoA synthase